MRMVKFLFMAIVLAATVGFAGCQPAETTDSKNAISLCGMCGQIKGTDVCCVADAPKCSKCGLAKGSPGCCKLPQPGKDAQLCSHCGQIKGTDVCCVADAPKCTKCGLAKGSPGCCKIPKA